MTGHRVARGMGGGGVAEGCERSGDAHGKGERFRGSPLSLSLCVYGACTGGEEDEDEGPGKDEKGRRDETALSRRKQDEGAPFRVQTTSSRTAKHHIPFSSSLPPSLPSTPRKLNNPHLLKALPLFFRVRTWLPST